MIETTLKRHSLGMVLSPLYGPELHFTNTSSVRAAHLQRMLKIGIVLPCQIH